MDLSEALKSFLIFLSTSLHAQCHYLGPGHHNHHSFCNKLLPDWFSCFHLWSLLIYLLCKQARVILKHQIRSYHHCLNFPKSIPSLILNLNTLSLTCKALFSDLTPLWTLMHLSFLYLKQNKFVSIQHLLKFFFLLQILIS